MNGSALMRRERARLAWPDYVPPADEDARRFLAEVEFESLVHTGQSSANRPLSVRRISSKSLDTVFAEQVGQLIAQRVPGSPPALAFLVQQSLLEMLQNVIEHASSPVDTIVMSRWYAEARNVRVAISDSGIGIVESMRRNPQHRGLTDDRKLVRRAVTEAKATGRTEGRFGGPGLKRLVRDCGQRGGGVHVTSGSVDAHYTLASTRETIMPRLEGTTIAFDFRPAPDDLLAGVSPTEDFF